MSRAATRGAVAVAAVIGLCGAGHRPVRIPPAPRLPVGTVFEVHKTGKGWAELVTEEGGAVHRKTKKARYLETRRYEVLAADHGLATKIRITYARFWDSNPKRKMVPNVVGHTFVVSLGRHPNDLPSVTENGAPVHGRIARRVRNDTMDFVVPKPILAVMRKVLAHPGKRMAIPVSLMSHFLSRGPVHLLTYSAELVRVAGGEAHLRMWIHTRKQPGPRGVLPLAFYTEVRSVLDGQGRILGSTEKTTMIGHRTLATQRGEVTFDERGGQTTNFRFDYHAKAKAPRARK